MLIEPGSDSGFRNIIEARDMILNVRSMGPHDCMEDDIALACCFSNVRQAVSWKDSELGTEGGGDQEGKRNNLEGHVFAPVSV